MIETPRERDERIHIEQRAMAFAAIATSLKTARQVLSRAPASIRHARRFAQDISIMIDAIEAQRHE